MKNPIRQPRSLIVKIIFLWACVVLPGTAIGDSDNRPSSNKKWVGTWATAPQSPTAPLPPFEAQTLRQIVHISVGGKQVRVRLSNVEGSEPLTIDAASVGIQDQFEDIQPETLRKLTFGGLPSVTIPVGARVLSDPVKLRVQREDNLAISLYLNDVTPAETHHAGAFQTSYFAYGDVTQIADINTFETTESWFFLTGVDVLTNRKAGAVVTLGDSITDGAFSSVDANNRWPDFLARRLNQGKNKMGVLNAGIGGNRVLNDFIGKSASSRLDRDVLTQTGVTHVILLEGVNDIGLPNIPSDVFPVPPAIQAQQVTAADIIAGMQQIIARVHARGLKIYGGTILPFKGALYYTEEGELTRQFVNEWIRNGGEFDGVIDFDAAIRDPSDPQMMRPEFDSGDNLHPSDAGMEAMANAIDLKLFKKKNYKFY